MRPVFWVAVVFTAVMALLPAPPQLLGPVSDRIQHTAAFAVLAILGFLAYPQTSKFRLLIWLSLFGAIIELLQGLPYFHRDRDVVDWIVDTLAAGATLLVLTGGHLLRKSEENAGP
jgi:hypothetical protein